MKATFKIMFYMLFMVSIVLNIQMYRGVVVLEDRIADMPKIELPEEYKAITKADNLKGYYDDNGVLNIEFNHEKVTFIWNDDEESIPVDNTPILLEFTKNDTIYIGPLE